jgi:Flp pilus assembly pilin Flp
MNVHHILVLAGRFVRRDEGQDLTEYALLAALIAIVAFGAVNSVGAAIYNVFWQTIGPNV